MWEIMERAGFEGDHQSLVRRAQSMLANPKIRTAVHAPDLSFEEAADDEDGLKKEMRLHLLRIVRGAGSDKEKVHAIDKVLATIPGGYVPVQVDMRAKLTLESLLSGAGLSPDQPQLPAARREDA